MVFYAFVARLDPAQSRFTLAVISLFSLDSLVKVGFSLKSMNLNFPPKLNLKLSITEKRYKTLLLERNVAI